jgi:hypothetical protein
MGAGIPRITSKMSNEAGALRSKSGMMAAEAGPVMKGSRSVREREVRRNMPYCIAIPVRLESYPQTYLKRY